MKYFAPIFVWYTAVYALIMLTLNVEEAKTQNVKKTTFCYDAGSGDANMKHVKGTSVYIALQQRTDIL